MHTLTGPIFATAAMSPSSVLGFTSMKPALVFSSDSFE
jgi:hypothetical protein